MDGRRNYDVRFRATTLLIPLARISTERNVSVAFKVYDMDRDGYISNGELFLVLKMMVGNNLKVFGPLFGLLQNKHPFAGFTAPRNRRQDNHGSRQGRRW